MAKRYQRGNQNPKIEEQTTQWPKEKGQKDRNNDLQNMYIRRKTEDRVIRTSLKAEVELRCPGRVNSTCSTSGIRRVTLVENSVIVRLNIRCINDCSPIITAF